MTDEIPDNQNFSNLTLQQYQELASATAIYPEELALPYLGLGLSGEAGEVANKLKKDIRDEYLDKEGLAAELGDVLWYIAMLCNELNISLNDVGNRNLFKLKQRQQKGTIKGSGDKR
jgi:NTP pyrophosphatase (non-canonical NTP hydrolase)